MPGGEEIGNCSEKVLEVGFLLLPVAAVRTNSFWSYPENAEQKTEVRFILFQLVSSVCMGELLSGVCGGNGARAGVGRK